MSSSGLNSSGRKSRIPAGRKKLAFIVSAYNEELKICGTIDKLLALSQKFPGVQYAIVVADDGSSDRTLKIVEDYANRLPETVGFVHFPQNIGVGAAFVNTALELTSDYVCCVPGDDMLDPRCFEILLEAAVDDRPVISFLGNAHKRAFMRRVISALYSGLWTRILRLNLKYINGTCTYRLDNIRPLDLKSERFCLFAELTAKTIIKGATYTSVPFEIQDKNLGSQAISPNQIKSLFELPRAYLSTLALLIAKR